MIRILLRQTGLGLELGPLYSAWVLNGDGTKVLLCNRARDPEHDACRELVRLGYAGPAETVDDRGMVRTHIGDIAVCAQYTMTESRKAKKGVFKLREYRSLSRGEEIE